MMSVRNNRSKIFSFAKRRYGQKKAALFHYKPYYIVQSDFESVDEILKCDHSNESY